MHFSKLYFSKLYFTKCISTNCISPNCIFLNCIFSNFIFFKLYFPKLYLSKLHFSKLYYSKMYFQSVHTWLTNLLSFTSLLDVPRMYPGESVGPPVKQSDFNCVGVSGLLQSVRRPRDVMYFLKAFKF